MKILSIDTSSKICSVSILEDNEIIIEKHLDNELTHSQKLMPLIDEILKSNNITLSDLDLFACSVGPGSFTGVRIGVSTVKAFNDVTNIPIVAVSSLESLAYNTLDSNYKNDAKLVLSIIDAKNDNVYYGLFKRNDDTFTLVEELDAKNIDEMIETLKKYHSSSILFVGDGAEKHQYHLLKHFSRATFVEDKHNRQTSTSVGKAGFHHYINGNYGDSNSISPLYLRKSQAERALEGEK